MKITIQKEVFKKFHSKFAVAFIQVKNISNEHVKESKHLLADIVRVVKLTHKKDTLKNNNLISPWEVLVEDKKKKAKHYQTSLEKLVRKVLNRKNLVTNSIVTNIVRYVSLKHLIPISADDVDLMKGGVVFKISHGRERLYTKLVKPGTLIYGDKKSPIGVKLDFRKNRRTKVTKKSTDVLVHLEALPPITKVQLFTIAKGKPL